MHLLRFELQTLQRGFKHLSLKGGRYFLQPYKNNFSVANPWRNHFLQYSTQCTNNQMPTANYIQLLPIILPISSHPNGKILLCKWSNGDYEGRYTGIIKQVDKAVDIKLPSLHEDTLNYVSKELMPQPLKKYTNKVELVGVLRFDGPPESDEYIFLVPVQIENKDLTMGIKSEEHPCYWFDWNKIPFGDMPADDAVWYPKVLWEYKKVRGSFIFGGTLERDIKSYELTVVTEL